MFFGLESKSIWNSTRIENRMLFP